MCKLSILLLSYLICTMPFHSHEQIHISQNEQVKTLLKKNSFGLVLFSTSNETCEMTGFVLES